MLFLYTIAEWKVWFEFLRGVNMYKLALVLVFAFALGYIVVEKWREYKSFMRWVQYPDLQDKGYHNLSDLVQCIINRRESHLERK